MRKLGIVLVLLVGLLTLGYFGYDQLGGNSPIEIDLVDSSPPSLAGKTYRGTPQDKALRDTFRSIETLLALHPGKKIHTIYFLEPAGKLDTMEVFVGLDLPFAPANLESMTFSETRFLLAKIQANRWVMPGPEKVKAALEAFARENKLTLSGVFIDRILNDNEVQVLAPVR